jgi:hypothetical protein
MEIRAVAAGKQTGWSPCAVQNGGCTHLCLFRQKSYVCACPDIPDHKPCSTGKTSSTVNLLKTYLTLSLLMSYIYIYGAPCKTRNFNIYVYGPMFGNAESHLFLFAAQCFNPETMQKVILWHSCV